VAVLYRRISKVTYGAIALTLDVSPCLALGAALVSGSLVSLVSVGKTEEMCEETSAYVTCISCGAAYGSTYAWKFAIYRKPTFTDTIIPYNSNHPNQHKYATVRFLYNRLNPYDLQEYHYNAEVTTIQNILHNNAFPILPPTPQPPPDTTKKQLTTSRSPTPTPKRDTFTYIGKETTFITNTFKKTSVKMAFRTNTIQKLLIHEQQNTDILSQSGVYKLTCPDCGKAYVGQTGRNFATRFSEHKNAFRTASHSSNFAKHVTEHAHSFGPIHNTMQIL